MITDCFLDHFRRGIVYAACQDRLGELLSLLPHRFGEEELIQAVSTLIGRPIHVEPRDMKGNFCGLRERYSDREVISFERNASPLHRSQIIAHELGHILCGHEGSVRLADIPPDEELAEMIDWSVLGISARTSYETAEEEEAELTATLIIQRMYRGTVLPASSPSGANERWDALFA
ncbi:ImmA/IrrE family metallo-endopeptidase [Kitasatospora sp. NPDC059327]|uniref:ImmA/IrrE family metallo-endopeptidase n=1 Tax=Kitasatospora sp. NPDC059327 TaxID=3346803 RepID=UPI003695ADFC